ncbi:MAG: Rrf2 family transcriptional regulator [Polyangia bacterium]
MVASSMLNRATRIGIAAMSALAESHGTDVPALTASQIARRRSIPQPFLAKVLTSLSRHELIRGTRGPGGGYVLARLAAEISLHDIATCFERLESTPLCPLGNRKACVARSPCPLHVPFQKVWEAQAAFLAETTLAGFTARKVPAPPRRR